MAYATQLGFKQTLWHGIVMDNRMESHWYALAVHARQEKAAARALIERGMEVFLPVRLERRAWSDRIKTVELALFPGYLFVHTHMNPARRVEILEPVQTVDLVGRLTGDDRIARCIPDHEIESLQTVVASQLDLDPVERFVRGASVLVASGPLRGAHGVVQRAPDGRRRLVVQIELLGRGVAVELAADDLVQSTSR